ncbi:MAG: type VI secretion system baseplate subunit TssF [Bacteroidales bacterium]|nr:type VI secretion system baseplate subunit TssF [Bacteroidales bacterium]
MELNNNRKEVIHARLKKSSAKIWDYAESETEGFDPVIDLLFGACAFEFERLSTELNLSQTRILEKVSQILLPEVYIFPSPSYSILHAKPVFPERFTDQTDQFFFDKEIIDSSNKISHKKVAFSPTSRFRLVDSEVAMMATIHEIYMVKELLFKEPAIKSETVNRPHKNHLWIGLRINPSVKSLKDISLYFDWINTTDKEDYLKLLPLIKLSSDGLEIQIKSGFSIEIDDRSESDTIDILSFLDINHKTEKKINSLFEGHFITITGDIMPGLEKYPSDLAEFFPVDELTKLKEELCWIRIEFPEVFPVEYLTSTVCTLNSFPVINRRLHTSNRPFTLNDDLNILPVITDDHFFSVRNIISSNHINYQEVPFRRLSDFAPGTYTIRTDGVKRFDERNARDYIQYLIELLREEHVAFKSLGSSVIEKELNDLRIIINRLTLNISKLKDLKANTHFIIIKSEMVEDVWLEFWSTSGTFGNNIQRGSNLLNNDFDKKNLKLLVTSAGGRNPPDQIERIFLFKKELLARDRVVTVEDIRVICFAELGSDLEEVYVSPGGMIIKGTKNGFQNCINVRLRFRKGMSIAEKENMVKYMSNTLYRKSSCIYKYNFMYED